MTDAVSGIASARSLLFVPGDRPDRFDRAFGSGADLVVVDLEDAVVPSAKDEARRNALSAMDDGARMVVRVNGLDTDWADADVALFDHPALIGVMVPKAEPTAALAAVAARCPVIALVETAGGVAALDRIAATQGVSRFALGTIDLANDLGMGTEASLFDPIRSSMIIASRLAGLAPPIDGVCAAFRDEALLREETIAAVARGFGGKLCIHPAQVGTIHDAMGPGQDDLERARRILDALNQDGTGACAVDGRMIDAPVAEWARRTLSRVR